MGGVYIKAEGTVTSTLTGLSATRRYDLGLPLAGAEFRAFLIPGSRLLNVKAEVQGMYFRDYGRHVRATPAVGLSFGPITFQAGYAILDAKIRESRNAGNRAGLAPRLQGPFFGVQFRDR